LSSTIWKGGTGLSAGVLLPNWKPKEMEVGKWNFAGFTPTQVLENYELESFSHLFQTSILRDIALV